MNINRKQIIAVKHNGERRRWECWFVRAPQMVSLTRVSAAPSCHRLLEIIFFFLEVQIYNFGDMPLQFCFQQNHPRQGSRFRPNQHCRCWPRNRTHDRWLQDLCYLRWNPSYGWIRWLHCPFGQKRRFDHQVSWDGARRSVELIWPYSFSYYFSGISKLVWSCVNKTDVL